MFFFKDGGGIILYDIKTHFDMLNDKEKIPNKTMFY